jgi:abscisic acid receptor (PYR/PYL family)
VGELSKMNRGDAFSAIELEYIGRHHRHEPRENQCTSELVKHIKAPVHLVSLL